MLFRSGLGGSIYAHYVSFIAPERFGMVPSFELLLAALLGGVGTPFGAVLGALLLIALPEGGDADLESFFRDRQETAARGAKE